MPPSPAGRNQAHFTFQFARVAIIEASLSAAGAPNASEWLTVAEAGVRLGLSRWTIGGWIARRALPATLIGDRRRICPRDLHAAQQLAHAGAVVPAWRRERLAAAAPGARSGANDPTRTR